MKKILILCLVTSSLFLVAVRAEEQTSPSRQNIRLKDGTVIKGQLVGVKDGKYLVDTANLGRIQIQVSDFESITAEKDALPNPITASATSASANLDGNPAMPSMTPQMQQISQLMFSDPQIMAALKDLVEDPTALPLMQDPGVLKAAMSMDPQQAQNNPAVQKLMQHPRMQQLMNLISRKILGPPSVENTVNPQAQ